MFFIYNPRLVSQAGRRRFDPRLPLQLFNRLQFPTFQQPAPKCSTTLRVAQNRARLRHDRMPPLVSDHLRVIVDLVYQSGVCPSHQATSP